MRLINKIDAAKTLLALSDRLSAIPQVLSGELKVTSKSRPVEEAALLEFVVPLRILSDSHKLRLAIADSVQKVLSKNHLHVIWAHPEVNSPSTDYKFGVVHRSVSKEEVVSYLTGKEYNDVFV